MGVTIRASSGVERDHNAHTVRMILRDIFDHSGNITQIAAPQRATNQKSESQISTSSRFIVGLLVDAGLAASALSAVLMGYLTTAPSLVLRANDLVLSATHLRNIEAERAGCAWIAAITGSRLKNRSADYYQNWYIRTAGFPNGVSIFIVCASPARKPHWFKSPLRALDRARVSRRGTTMLLANTRRACEAPNDPLDHPGNLPTHRPLADRVSRANLEIVEPLARVDMRTGNAAAPR